MAQISAQCDSAQPGVKLALARGSAIRSGHIARSMAPGSVRLGLYLGFIASARCSNLESVSISIGIRLISIRGSARLGDRLRGSGFIARNLTRFGSSICSAHLRFRIGSGLGSGLQRGTRLGLFGLGSVSRLGDRLSVRLWARSLSWFKAQPASGFGAQFGSRLGLE